MRTAVSIAVVLLFPIFSQAASKGTGGDAVVYPDALGAEITDWGYDIKQPRKAALLTPQLARDLFVTDQLTCLRVAIYGDKARPAHPGPGVVVDKYYADQLAAMTNAREARSDVLFYADKKLESQETFPDWCKDANGILPAPYARMLADYLQFMKDHGFAIDILGINCEPEGNEGVFTAAKHKKTIDELRRLSKSPGFSFVMPPRIVCPNTIDPGYGYDKEGNARGAQFLKELDDNGWGDRLDMAGTHYYHGDAWRPRSDLDDFCREAGDRPKWNTEVHWKDQGADVMSSAERAMAGLFDCIDAGMTGFVWWSYRREETDLKSSLIHRLTLSMLGSRPIDMDDVDGRGMQVSGQLLTRGFRKGLNVTLWVINNNDSTAYIPYKFNLATQTISGEAAYTQWTATAKTTGAATRISDAVFAADIPAKTITEITFLLAAGVASQSLGKTRAPEEEQ